MVHEDRKAAQPLYGCHPAITHRDAAHGHRNQRARSEPSPQKKQGAAMTRVVLFEHQGVRTAVPASQVLRLSAEGHDAQDALTVALWPGACKSKGRLLVFRGADFDLALWGECVNIHELEQESLRALPRVLRELLCDMPYVVGAAWIKDNMFWLVDLSRFSARLSHE
jgi:hypothetical protein